jgi:hypothetical protein
MSGAAIDWAVPVACTSTWLVRGTPCTARPKPQETRTKPQEVQHGVPVPSPRKGTIWYNPEWEARGASLRGGLVGCNKRAGTATTNTTKPALGLFDGRSLSKHIHT